MLELPLKHLLETHTEASARVNRSANGGIRYSALEATIFEVYQHTHYGLRSCAEDDFHYANSARVLKYRDFGTWRDYVFDFRFTERRKGLWVELDFEGNASILITERSAASLHGQH